MAHLAPKALSLETRHIHVEVPNSSVWLSSHRGDHMRTLFRRFLVETDGSTPLFFALAGGGVTALIILQPGLLAKGLAGLAFLLRTAAAQLLPVG